MHSREIFDNIAEHSHCSMIKRNCNTASSEAGIHSAVNAHEKKRLAYLVYPEASILQQVLELPIDKAAATLRLIALQQPLLA